MEWKMRLNLNNASLNTYNICLGIIIRLMLPVLGGSKHPLLLFKSSLALSNVLTESASKWREEEEESLPNERFITRIK